MRKKLVSLLSIVVIVVLGAFAFTACNHKTDNGEHAFALPSGTRPQLPNRLTADDRTVIEAGLKSGASADEARAAALRLYDVANQSRIQAGVALMVQDSVMGIGSVDENSVVDDFGLKVKMRGFTLSDGKRWFNQFVAKGEAGGLEVLFGSMTDMAKVSYRLEDDSYYFINLSSGGVDLATKVDHNEFPYASFKLVKEPVKYDRESFIQKAHILTAPNELCNVDFAAAVLNDDAEIAHENGVYSVKFSINLLQSGEEWFREPKADMADGNQTLERYCKFKCELELWDNGYAKSFTADYARVAKGMSSNATLDKYTYIWNEDEILDIISDDFRLAEMSDLEKAVQFDEVSDYIDYYIGIEVQSGRLAGIFIALITIGCVIVVAIVCVVVIEILVRCGKLPGLAAKRAERKQKKLAKKQARLAAKQARSEEDPIPEEEKEAAADIDE